MTDPLEEGTENYANRMEFRLGPSLKYPLAIHAYRGRIPVRRINIKWSGVPGVVWKIAVFVIRYRRLPF
jgi:hypothetical protein